MVFRFKQEKNTMLRYASRFATIYRIEPRLNEAQMILSLGSNKLKLVESQMFLSLLLFELEFKCF